ncbi:hypothetical protein ABEP82_00270 [Cutibacterium acnes]
MRCHSDTEPSLNANIIKSLNNDPTIATIVPNDIKIRHPPQRRHSQLHTRIVIDTDGSTIISYDSAGLRPGSCDEPNYQWSVVWLYLREVKIITGISYTILLTRQCPSEPP